jgi:hypothetical protein
MAKEPGFAGKALRDRLSEAEALLTKVYDALSRVPQPPNRLFESVLQGLAELYDVWHAAEPDQGHDAKAAQWRTRLAEWQASTQPAASERAPPAPSP